MKRFRTIVADPPWPVKQPPKTFTTSGNGSLPYPTMSPEAIRALPVGEVAAEYAHLYLWVVNRFVPDAYEVAKAWGFRPTMLLTWCKNPIGVGPGREFASTTEFILQAKRGHGVAAYPERHPTNWWNWPRGAHSSKPDAFLDIVEQVSPGPYLEMFARRARLGWDYYGDESLGTVEIEAA